MVERLGSRGRLAKVRTATTQRTAACVHLLVGLGALVLLGWRRKPKQVAA
jgi:hypothetical protein